MLRHNTPKKLYPAIQTLHESVHHDAQDQPHPQTQTQEHDEYQYLNLIHDIMHDGIFEEGRNGFTKSVFGASHHYSLEHNTVPFLTTKRLAWKTCLKELLWFIKGDTSNTRLRDVGVHIWDANASREYLDGRGLGHYMEHDLGPVYGHQWRHFNAPYESCNTDYAGKGVDQISQIITTLKTPAQRTSRRIILTAWNPAQLAEMALPPCHILAQFNVSNGDELSCALYQRSGDVGLGVPFNIASYSLLTHMLAHHCGLKAKEFIHHLGNAHIYDDHIEPLKTQLLRRPHPFPTLQFKDHCAAYTHLEQYTADDFVIQNYVCHEPLRMLVRS